MWIFCCHRFCRVHPILSSAAQGIDFSVVDSAEVSDENMPQTGAFVPRI